MVHPLAVDDHPQRELPLWDCERGLERVDAVADAGPLLLSRDELARPVRAARAFEHAAAL